MQCAIREYIYSTYVYICVENQIYLELRHSHHAKLHTQVPTTHIPLTTRKCVCALSVEVIICKTFNKNPGPCCSLCNKREHGAKSNKNIMHTHTHTILSLTRLVCIIKCTACGKCAVVRVVRTQQLLRMYWLPNSAKALSGPGGE